MRKELSYLILELHTVKIESLSMRKKGTTQCDKRIVICNVGTAQCEDETVKCEKKTVTCDVRTA